MVNQDEMVETGESRTPRPETPLSGYATSLFGALVLLSPTPADGMQQQPADKIYGPGYRRLWGSIPELLDARFPASGPTGGRRSRD